MMVKGEKVSHFATGQRYWSTREDGKRVDMVSIACAGTRVYLPRGHTATNTLNINCKECIDKIIRLTRIDLAKLERAAESAITSNVTFKITKRERDRRELAKWMRAVDVEEPDLEMMERIKHGV